MTHICVGKLTTTCSDNGLSPGRRQAILWTNAGIMLIGPLGANFGDILSEIQTFSLRKIHLKIPSAKCCPFHLGLNGLTIVMLFAALCCIGRNYNRTLLYHASETDFILKIFPKKIAFDGNHNFCYSISWISTICHDRDICHEMCKTLQRSLN